MRDGGREEDCRVDGVMRAAEAERTGAAAEETDEEANPAGVGMPDDRRRPSCDAALTGRACWILAAATAVLPETGRAAAAETLALPATGTSYLPL